MKLEKHSAFKMKESNKEALFVLLEKPGRYAEATLNHKGAAGYKIFEKNRSPVKFFSPPAIAQLYKYGAVKKIQISPDRFVPDLQALKMFHKKSSPYKIYKYHRDKRKASQK